MPSRIALQAFVPPLPPPIIPTAAPPEPSPVLQPEVVAAPPGTLTPFAPSAFPVEAASAPTASAFPDPGPPSNATATSTDGDTAPVEQPAGSVESQPGVPDDKEVAVGYIFRDRPKRSWYDEPAKVIPYAVIAVLVLLLAALVIGLFVKHRRHRKALEKKRENRAQPSTQHHPHAHNTEVTQLPQSEYTPGVNLSSVAIAEEPVVQIDASMQQQHVGTIHRRWPPPAPPQVQTRDGESSQLNVTNASDAFAPAQAPPAAPCQPSISRAVEERTEQWVQGGETSTQSAGAQPDAADTEATKDLQNVSERLSDRSGSRGLLGGFRILRPSSTNDMRQSSVLCGWCKLAPKKRLCFALDFLHQEHRAFCQFYQLLSPTQRRFGPSSVVHFAKDLRTEAEVALKFFTEESPEASGVATTAYLLADERARVIMHGPPIAIASPAPLTVPPPAFILNSPHSTPPASPARSPARQQHGTTGSDGLGQSCDHVHGEPVLYAFPPCVVSPRGNSLSSWGQFIRKQTDRRMGCMALVGVTRTVAQLHAAGYVHRGIKPSNVLKLIQENKWVVSDYARTAPNGSRAPVVCTSYYCPPESAQAQIGQQQVMPVHTSTDIWALGVLALEILTHVRDPNGARPASPGVEPRSPPRIVSALGGPDFGSRGSVQNMSGRVPGLGGWSPEDILPWEGDSEVAEVYRRQLGQLREIVLACVNRNSAQRPSVGVILAAFERERRDVVRNAAAGRNP